ncbi:MAG: PD-(D/E)XK nuclease family protein [Sideroxyarcus sp.]|nr:PD-(D/E)XK nuclease family protein [Sideroxyarcus sp.]
MFDLADKLNQFVDTWNRLPHSIDHIATPSMDSVSLKAELVKFIDEWNLLPAAEIVCPRALAPLDSLKLEQFVKQFQPALNQAQATGIMANIWKSSGLGRNEVRVASALNWFLDCLGDHGQQHNLCQALLEYLNNQKCGSRPENFPDQSSLLDSNGAVRYRATTEVCPLGEQKNRVDIEINGPGILLFIEVKIGAVQGLNQLSRYRDIAMLKAAGRPWGVVYLTVSGGLPEKDGQLSNIVDLTWRDLAAVFRHHAKQLHGHSMAKHHIKQFADFVVKF